MMWFAVTSCKLSPTRYFEFFVRQLPHETSQLIVDGNLKLLDQLMTNYIPPSMIAHCMTQMFDTLLSFLQKPIEDDLKIPIVDKIFDYISSEDSEKLAQSWLEKQYIHTKASPDINLFAIKRSHFG